MSDREKVIKGLECLITNEVECDGCPYNVKGGYCLKTIAEDALALMKEHEPIKPTINEYGEAFCICGENVGIIPSSKNLPSVRSKYCSECGRRMKWE